MRAKLANLNDCAVPFLSRAATNLCRYYYSRYKSQGLSYMYGHRTIKCTQYTHLNPSFWSLKNAAYFKLPYC